MDTDIIGCVFGRLTVRRLAGYIQLPSGKRMSVWECLCTCGVTKEVKRANLTSGDTQSCGCLHKDQLIERNKKHGDTGTLTYKKWLGMHRRIRSADTLKNKCYRGVSICDEWASYEVFKQDMGQCPDGYSLDRIDNREGYTPANCRWVPLARQAANTTRNVFIYFNGITATISDHAKANGIKPDVVFDRINKLGWSPEDAVSIPTMGIGKKRSTV